jgi:hypothetical protein
MSEPAAYSPDEFCTLHRICRATLYGLWRKGDGPKFFMIGNRRRISAEAAADWRRAREMATAQEVAA